MLCSCFSIRVVYYDKACYWRETFLQRGCVLFFVAQTLIDDTRSQAKRDGKRPQIYVNEKTTRPYCFVDREKSIRAAGRHIDLEDDDRDYHDKVFASEAKSKRRVPFNERV